jgi:hypothetical protein
MSRVDFRLIFRVAMTAVSGGCLQISNKAEMPA